MTNLEKAMKGLAEVKRIIATLPYEAQRGIGERVFDVNEICKTLHGKMAVCYVGARLSVEAEKERERIASASKDAFAM